jgi:hypothetical protein
MSETSKGLESPPRLALLLAAGTLAAGAAGYEPQLTEASPAKHNEIAAIDPYVRQTALQTLNIAGNLIKIGNMEPKIFDVNNQPHFYHQLSFSVRERQNPGKFTQIVEEIPDQPDDVINLSITTGAPKAKYSRVETFRRRQALIIEPKTNTIALLDSQVGKNGKKTIKIYERDTNNHKLSINGKNYKVSEKSVRNAIEKMLINTRNVIGKAKKS